MQVKVNFLENLRLKACFDDFSIIADQPVRYKGDGTAPGPFDYFLASSALCAGYFIKVYCETRGISTEGIEVNQNNIVDPENRYKQTITIDLKIPGHITEHDREGILKAVDRCTVKRVIQNNPEFKINIISQETSSNLVLEHFKPTSTKTMILGKDSPLEETILNMTKLLEDLGIKIEIASWRNPLPHVWSVHIRDSDSPMCFTNGKGATKDAALCSALGEYLERISTNYFYSDFYLGHELSQAKFVHYPNEKWFPVEADEIFPKGLMDEHLLLVYGNNGELRPSHLFDTNTSKKRGVCALPFIRQSDSKEIFIPVNLIANIFVSNGMSAGNTIHEARVQALSEIFERAIKNKIIREEITLPDVPRSVLERFPKIIEGINKLEAQGFPILVKDASLGGKFPVMNVTLMNPKNGGVFASFGAHPNFEVALERSLTELLQGRSFEGMNDTFPPTFNEFAIKEHNNIVDHFIDSTGIISWKFFSQKPDFEFHDWNFSGNTQDEFNYLMGILSELKKEVYIADYEELGAKACRILVPNFSEIYLPEELIWDNHNKSLDFRDDILNLHMLNNQQLKLLVEKLEESRIDNYTLIGELIGIAFDENSPWGQCCVGELKSLLYLALQKHTEAKELVEMLSSFSNSLPERKRFYQALNVILDIKLRSDLELSDYQVNLNLMFGPNLVNIVSQTVDGKLRFFDLGPTNIELKGLDKHLKLIESYKKLHKKKTVINSEDGI